MAAQGFGGWRELPATERDEAEEVSAAVSGESKRSGRRVHAAPERPGKTIPTSGTHKAEREKEAGCGTGKRGPVRRERKSASAGKKGADRSGPPVNERERGRGSLGRGKENGPRNEVGGPPEK